jgi:hypothetical protein
MICEDCGITDKYASIDVIECPYSREIHGEELIITVCSECYDTRAGSI